MLVFLFFMGRPYYGSWRHTFFESIIAFWQTELRGSFAGSQTTITFSLLNITFSLLCILLHLGLWQRHSMKRPFAIRGHLCCMQFSHNEGLIKSFFLFILLLPLAFLHSVWLSSAFASIVSARKGMMCPLIAMSHRRCCQTSSHDLYFRDFYYWWPEWLNHRMKRGSQVTLHVSASAHGCSKREDAYFAICSTAGRYNPEQAQSLAKAEKVTPTCMVGTS